MVRRIPGWLGAAGLLLLSTPAEAQVCFPGDFTAPDLVITSPDRSEAITQGGTADDIVAVVGAASDAQSTITSVTIDGIEAVVGPGSTLEPFSIDTTSRWGLNTIVAVARDACGNEQTVVQSYLRSASYLPAATGPDPGATSTSGLLTQLNAPAIDDHERSSLDDAASIMENAIPSVPSGVVPTTIKAANNPPCSSILDNWVTGQNKVRVRKTSFSMSDIEVSDLIAGTNVLLGVGSVDSFSLGIQARAYSCVAGNLTFIEKNGTIGADDSSIAFLVDLSVVDHELVATVTDVGVNLSLTASIDCALQVICNAVINLAIPIVEPQLETALEDALTDAIVEQNLAAFVVGPVTKSQSIGLPAPIGISVELEAALDTVDVSPGAVLLDSSGQFYPNARGPSIPLAAPGSIHRNEPVVTTFDLVPYELGNMSRDDLLNQFLWAIWYGGGLDIPDLTGEAAAAGIPLDQFSHDSGLPQVLMPGGAPGRIEVGKGDTLFTIDGDLADLAPPLSGPLVVTGYWSSLVGGTIELDEGEKRLAFVPDAGQASVEILAINNPLLKSTVVAILEEKFAALDVAFVIQTVSQIELPRTNSANVGGSSGRELSIANATSDRPDDNALRVTGDLVESAICGDGLILLTETCDDGNAEGRDGCSASCEVESGHVCSGEPSFCTNTCGDSVIDPSEACDDGGQIDGDGCSATCQLQDSYTFTGTALGGANVSLLVNGQLIDVPTEAGESAAAIAQKLANAINWALPSVVAGATGNQLYVTGLLTQVVITDAGLVAPAPTPALGLIARLALILGLILVGRAGRQTPG